jgi:hypothetical protein
MQALPHRALIHWESHALISRRSLRYRERDAGFEQQSIPW